MQEPRIRKRSRVYSREFSTEGMDVPSTVQDLFDMSSKTVLAVLESRLTPAQANAALAGVKLMFSILRELKTLVPEFEDVDTDELMEQTNELMKKLLEVKE